MQFELLGVREYLIYPEAKHLNVPSIHADSSSLIEVLSSVELKDDPCSYRPCHVFHI